MKAHILILSLVIPAFIKVDAQSLVPEKSTIDHNNKSRPCLVVCIDPEPNTLKKAWVDYLRKEYDFKMKGVGWFRDDDLLYSEEVLIPKLSAKEMDFYTNVVEDENGSEMSVFASLGYDIYLNEERYPVEFQAMNDMMVSFLKEYLPQYYNNQIHESEDRVKSLNKEISHLKDDISNNKKSIVEHNKEIENLTKSVAENSDKLIAAELKLQGRQDKLTRVKTRLDRL